MTYHYIATLRDHRAVVAVGTKRADAAQPSVLPPARDQVLVGAGHPRHRFASRTHDGEQHLDRVDGVPRQVQLVMLLERSGTPRRNARDPRPLLGRYRPEP